MDTARVDSQTNAAALKQAQAAPRAPAPVQRPPEPAEASSKTSAPVRRHADRDGVRVEISERARELRDLRGRAKPASQEPQPTTPGTEPPRAPDPGRSNLPMIAVTQGIPPVETLQRDSEEVIRQQLAERAGIRRLDHVISTPQEESRAGRVKAEPARAEATLNLPGTGRAAQPTLPGAEAARAASLPATRAERPEAPRTQDGEAARRERVARVQEEIQRVDQRQDLELAFAAAPQSGVARSEEASQQRRHDVELMGESEESAREQVAQEVLTQAGVVEAQYEAELVTRFSERAFEQDLGRPERVREVLGQRSRPVSADES